MNASDYVLPMAATAFAWWGTTGVIAFLDGLPRRTFPTSLLAATVVLVASLYGLWATADDATVGGAYVAFACGLGVWAWLEMSFLMGFVTGPRRHACPPGCAGRKHFVHAVEAILWHELAILAAGIAVVALAWDGTNRVGAIAFLLLWGMRTSAKLNMFLGVRNLGEAFLPDHLRYLLSFFRRRAMNLLFPVAITAGTWITVYFVRYALGADDEATAVGFTLLATLSALGVLEHWLLVLPLPGDALWRWTLEGRAARERALRYAGDAPP